jgi:hypothetical protein
MKISLNTYFYIIGFSFILLISIYFIFFCKRYKINQNNYLNNTNIIFNDYIQTSIFLEKDNDKYINKMSKADLYARKCSTHNDYIKNIIKCSISFSDKEKEKLQYCAQKADIFLKNYYYLNTFSCEDIANIKWKFALTYKNGENEYEEGLPHTREDIIFLSKYNINENIANDTSDNHELVALLIHEKIHIYQRYNHEIMKKIIEKLGYILLNTDMKDDLKRSNPDIDEKIYSIDGKEMVFRYKNHFPSRINDIDSNNFSIEHPNEKMAYDIQNAYIRKNANYMKNL